MVCSIEIGIHHVICWYTRFHYFKTKTKGVVSEAWAGVLVTLGWSLDIVGCCTWPSARWYWTKPVLHRRRGKDLKAVTVSSICCNVLKYKNSLSGKDPVFSRLLCNAGKQKMNFVISLIIICRCFSTHKCYMLMNRKLNFMEFC